MKGSIIMKTTNETNTISINHDKVNNGLSEMLKTTGKDVAFKNKEEFLAQISKPLTIKL